jgi:hypothetical protein
MRIEVRLHGKTAEGAHARRHRLLPISPRAHARVLLTPEPSARGLMVATLPQTSSDTLKRDGKRGVGAATQIATEEIPLMSAAEVTNRPAKQLLHLVFGGELKSLTDVDFANLDELDIVGIFPNYAEAYKAWKAVAQKTVDNAQMRYFIVHIHRLLDPGISPPPRT